ncbi:helix-turn-helix transcriptional regulator [Nocardia stercoris]|uniref:helix-turn-helix transcriptional regulator n=1 Tax=Nocardia stercoris TaxID=2483361 RepID=UPI0018F2AE26|nr:LuxR family transcriptional regulator [Nocardia stercoris]
MLIGRDRELRDIDELLQLARTARSGAVHLVGDPGIGKTALLDYAAEHADSLRVLRASGVESEAELPYAGLQMLLWPLQDRIDELPAPQAAAVRAAFGQAAGEGSDRFLVGLATLTLLDAAAPVLCLIDDAHWLDQASVDALLFTARRLAGEGIAMVLASRPEFTAPGLRQRPVAALDAAAARRLLDEQAADLTGPARDRVLAEAAGNPLALRELPAALDDPPATGLLPLPHRLAEAYHRRISALPGPARTLLLVAAAEETGNLSVIGAAAARLDVPLAAVGAAEAAGLVDVAAPMLRFRHPLMTAAAYHSMTYAERLAVHGALAEVLTDSADADRRAWHLGCAATGFDPEAAAALEAAADRARRRTGYRAAATALLRAAQLTPESADRGRRLIAAAEAAETGGQREFAADLADQARRFGTDLRSTLLRTRLAFDSGSLRDAFETALGAIDSDDPAAVATLLAEAARIAFYAGELDWARRVHERFTALGFGDDHPAAPTVTASYQWLIGDTHRSLARCRAFVARERHAADSPLELRSNAASQALLAGDFDTCRAFALELTERCRIDGSIGRMPLLLITLAVAEVYLGRFRDGALALTEGVAIAQDTGQSHRLAHLYGVQAWLAAAAGDEERCRELAGRNLAHFAADSVATSGAWGEWALALLDLGSGRWQAVVDRLAAIPDPIRHQIHAVCFAPDHVEAAVYLGDSAGAAAPFERFRNWADAAQQPWADAVLHRCRALLTSDEQHFAAALACPDRPFEQARSHLVYGEWLRRAHRRVDARTQLRAAQEIFERLGADLWARRAATELRATGETRGARGRSTSAVAALTPQELQIVRLAATGATNKDIAARLFLSPKTVSHHLYRAFPKLGVTVRTELAHLDLD